ncbi:MAG: B12-binding domain-containing radical SAM protein [Myxococcales bacterium]|nr:B12-binding domain-containing radical SAM protein [Myxococcales bacterium]
MKIALVYPPTCDPTAPYLAVPMLTGFLRANGVEVLPIDANVEAYDRLLRPAPLRACAERVTSRLGKLDRRGSLDHSSRREYLQLWRARGDAQAAPDGVDEARAVLKDPERFFIAADYERAVETIESALRLVSAAYAPLDLTFSGYRTPFALTTPEEIADDARAERDPFDDYVCAVLAPRLREARVDAIGISVCFPGQLQPAYAFALKLKRLLPDVHLTCGGPGITQLFIRLQGHDLARALGPFDSAVVFEGEHALLGLCRALDDKRPLRGLPNVVHRDPLLGAKYASGEGAEDLRVLPAPDFDGLPLDLYFSPSLTLPYDPTRGCYWGKCTFCHYGLAETGTASYRERGAERTVDHLTALADKYGTRHFYLSQDSVAPKTLLKIAQEISRRGLEANPRVLAMIDKGAPVSTVRETISHLAEAGLAVEAMCFTDFPTETYAEAMDTLRFLEELKHEVALYIVGEFDLTHGALVAKEPERFGIRETWQLDGDLLGTGLFYEEKRASKRAADGGKLDAALDRLSAGWRVRRYPWAGSLSTAHTVLHYDKFGPGVFRERARLPGAQPFGARSGEAQARFDLSQVARSDDDELAIWHELVRGQRHVSRAAYQALAKSLPRLRPSPRRYRFTAGEPPVPSRAGPRGRRPPNASNAAG